MTWNPMATVPDELKAAPAQWVNLGVMPYEECHALQRDLAEGVREGRRGHTLLLVEHPPVLTLGSAFHTANLLLPREEYARRGIQVVETDRGGDVTYHGPGQLVIYPIFDLDRLMRDLHWWLRNLEEAIIVALRNFGISGERKPPHTGVWVRDRKIAAIGVKVRRWVNLHGIALNCENDLAAFELIVPCGIREYGVTSIEREIGRSVGPEDAKAPVVRAFEEVFGLGLRYESLPSRAS
jgi:lipoyl(octanoyl) transferase